MHYEVPFQCEIAREEEGVRVRVFGSLDMATSPELDAKLTELYAARHRLIILDLGDLDFIDSSGLRLLLGWDAVARSDGMALHLVPGPPAVQLVFDVTGTADAFTFRPA